MSDSDDTDALLLVPPDFFYIHSDSEDNLFCDVPRTQNSELERMVVSDLIDHVSELENRVHLIEHKDSLTPYCCKSIYGKFWDSTVDALHSGNNCTLHHSTVDMSATPVKNRLLLSLPSSPSGGYLTYQHQPLERSIQSDSAVKHHSEEVKPRVEIAARMMQPKAQNEVELSHQAIGNVSSPIKETAGLNSTEEYAAPLVTNHKQDLMSEIDDFLNSAKKKQPEGAEENNIIFSDSAGHQWQRNFESSSFPFFAHSQTFPSVKQFDAMNTEMKGLALSDVGRLLDEVETTQTGIMHKLHEINKPLAVKSASHRTSQSVPKLDFIEPSNKPQPNLLISSTGEKANVNTSDNSETGCQVTECSTTLTESMANANHESTFNRSGLKSAKRKLDLSCEFTPSSNLAIKTTEVSHGSVVVEFATGSSNTTLASSVSGFASTSQAPLTLRNVPVPNRQSSSSDVAEHSSHLQNYSHFPQRDHAAVVSTNGGSTFSTHTYPPLTSGRAHSSAVGSSVLHAQSLEPEARFGFMQAVPLCAPSEIMQGEARQPSGPTKALPSCNVNNAASGDHIIQEPLNLSYGNDPVTTMRPNFLMDKATQGSGNLLSLSELWIGDELFGPHKDDMINPVQKLEEERYRRQHCERLIRQLQSRLLEEQQKVAVAVEVDRAKDRAILQLQASWRQLVGHWHELEEQRHSVTNTLHHERESFHHDLAQTQQRVKHLERELSRMLDVTQDYKEKSEALSRDSEQSKRQHELELQEVATKVQQLEQALSSASEAFKESRAKEEELVSQFLSAKQDVDKEKQAKETFLRELEQSREMLARLEGELLSLKEEKASLQIKLKEEKTRNSLLLDKQKKAFLVALDDIKKKEKAGREEARLAGEKLERVKTELRDHYQQQVEKVVQEKMQEFQAQLDADETSMRNELQQRERAVTELAAQQIKQIADKHEVEMRLIGEKHREEQQLLRLQLSQSMQKVANLQTTLTQLKSHRSHVAERLHAIMEAQWQESVRVIAGSSSPLHPSKLGTSEQAWEVPPLPLHGLDSGSSSMDSIPFGQDGQLTHRMKTDHLQQVTAPQPDRGDELKKYVSMLLKCKPGNPVGELSEIPTSECGHIPARTQPEYLGIRMEYQDHHCAVQGQVGHLNLAEPGSVSSSQESQAGKPPWR